MARGGYRENAGRPATGRRRVFIYVTEEEEALVRAEIERMRAAAQTDQQPEHEPTREELLENHTGQQRLIEPDPSRQG